MRPVHVLAAVVCVLCHATRAAAADVTITQFVPSVSANDHVGTSVTHPAEFDPTPRTFSESATDGGAGGTLTAGVVSTAAGFTVTSHGTTQAGAASDANSSARLTVRFTTTVATSYSLAGSIQHTGGNLGSARAALHSTGPDVFAFQTSSADPPGERDVGQSGELAAGDWVLEFSAGSDVQEEPTSASGEYEVTLTIGPPQPAGATIRWRRPSGGQFAVAGNWNPHRVPVKDSEHADTALFRLPGAYTVHVGTQTTEALVVSSGRPSFVAGDWTLASASAAEPSVIVTGGAQLALGNSFALRGHDALIGETGSTSEVRVRHASALWSSSGMLTIGGHGKGALAISAGTVVSGSMRVGGDDGAGSVDVFGPDSELQTGDCSIAFGDTGVFSVRGGALTESGDVSIGANNSAGSAALVLADGVDAPTDRASTWRVTSMALLGGSDSSVTIRRGALVETSAGVEIGGFFGSPPRLSEVIVEQKQGARPARLHVGGALYVGSLFGIGPGRLVIRPGGEVRTESDVGIGNDVLAGGQAMGTVDVAGGKFTIGGDGDPVLLGHGTGARGVVRVTQGGRVLVEGLREVWVADAGGTGELVVGDAGAVGSGFASIDDIRIGTADPAGRGEVRVLPRSFLITTGTITVLANGILTGERRVTASSIVRKRGSRALKAAPLPDPASVECAELVNHGTITPRALTLHGSFAQGPGGTLVAEISGAGPAKDEDRFVVTGAAALDGKLVLQFVDGFAPKTGDQFSVVNVGGAASGAFATVEVEGLVPGALFETTIAGGVLTAEALNDGVALPTVSVRNAGGSRRAFEKQRRRASFLVSRSGAVTGALTVNYAAGGTAENGADYALLGGSVVIPAGKRSLTLHVRPVDDTSPEGPETVELRIVAGAEATNSRKSRATVTIVDDERRRRRQ